MTFEKLSNISLLCRKQQEKNKDVLLITTGEKGDGKSNYTMQQARDYVEKFGLKCNACGKQFMFNGNAISGNRDGDVVLRVHSTCPCPSCKSTDISKLKKFDFNEWLAYDADELEKKIYELPKYSPLISDELARFALTEAWNSVDSKNIKKLLIQCRTKRFLIMGNIPNFVTLDKKYRNMANYWVRILQRDLSSACALFMKSSKGEFDDKFHIKELQELLGDYFEDTPMPEIIRIAMKVVQKHPCCEDYFMIPPLPQDMYDDYEIYRDAKVFERNEEDIVLDQRQMSKVLVYNLVKHWREMSDAVSKGRYEKPSLKMVEEFLTRNPKTGHSLVRYTTIRNWIRDVEAVMRVGTKEVREAEKPLEVADG
jgi:hypothetical protein